MKKIIIGLLISSVAAVSCKKKLQDITSDAIYVANEDGGTISVINAEDYQVIKTIDLMDNALLDKNDQMYMAHNVQVAPDGKSVWVTAVPMDEHGENQVIVIDPFKNKIKDRITVGKDQHVAHVVIDDESKFAYVTANESNQIIQIDVEKRKETKRFDLGSGKKPHGLRYSAGKLYVANMDGKSLSIVDVNSGAIQEINLGGVAVQTAVTKDGQYAFASLYDTKEIAKISTNGLSLKKIALPSAAQGPIQLYPHPNGQYLYICDQGGLLGRPEHNKVYVLDIAQDSIIGEIQTGNKTHGIVVDETGAKAYATNTSDNTVSVIDLNTLKVSGNISVGKGPNGIACWHAHDNTFGGQP